MEVLKQKNGNMIRLNMLFRSITVMIVWENKLCVCVWEVERVALEEPGTLGVY